MGLVDRLDIDHLDIADGIKFELDVARKDPPRVLMRVSARMASDGYSRTAKRQ